MSNLTFTEKRKLEQLLGMKTGYVLDFSDRTFAEFVSEATGRNIFDERYNYASGSKSLNHTCKQPTATLRIWRLKWLTFEQSLSPAHR